MHFGRGLWDVIGLHFAQLCLYFGKSTMSLHFFLQCVECMMSYSLNGFLEFSGIPTLSGVPTLSRIPTHFREPRLSRESRFSRRIPDILGNPEIFKNPIRPDVFPTHPDLGFSHTSKRNRFTRLSIRSPIVCHFRHEQAKHRAGEIYK